MSLQSGSDGSTSSNSPTLVQASLANFEMLDLAKTESGSLTNADASDAGWQPRKLSDSEPKKDCVAPIDSTGGPKGVPDVTRKFLNRHRKLMGKLTKMQKDFKLCSTPEQFNNCSTNFDTLKSSFASYCRDLKLQVTDPDKFDEINERLKDAYDNCYDNYDECKLRVVGCPHDDSEVESVVESADSASQVTGYTATTNKSCEIRQIELAKRRTELKASFELAEAREAKARAEAAKAQAKAEMLAKLRIEEARIEAEEKLIACSERGSVAASRRSRTKSLHASTSGSTTTRAGRCEFGTNAGFRKISNSKTLKTKQAESKSFLISHLSKQPDEAFAKERTKSWMQNVSNSVPISKSAVCVSSEVAPHVDPTSVVHNYLEREGRNEYINLTSQINYNGSNIAFVFYENQIRKLMEESPFEERRPEVLRASCVGELREMVNLFFAPFKNMMTQQRIDRALERLRQRYGVPNGFVSKPKVAEVRNAPKVTHTVSSLKSFNEDLITLEVFAYGHNQVEKLSGQLLLDPANRLPANLKRRYLDKLDKSLLDLNQPSFEGFELLRKYVAHEIKLMTSDYAQALFKTKEKDKSRECKSIARVRQTAVSIASKPNNVSNRQGLKHFDAGSEVSVHPLSPLYFPNVLSVRINIILQTAINSKFYIPILNDKRFSTQNGA